MLEKHLERKFVDEVKRRGGICPKWVAPGFDGVPDRIVILPGRHIGFVEIKAPGKKLRKLQEARFRLLEKLGFAPHVLDGEEKIGVIIDDIQDS